LVESIFLARQLSEEKEFLEGKVFSSTCSHDDSLHKCFLHQSWFQKIIYLSSFVHKNIWELIGEILFWRTTVNLSWINFSICICLQVPTKFTIVLPIINKSLIISSLINWLIESFIVGRGTDSSNTEVLDFTTIPYTTLLKCLTVIWTG